MEPYADQLFDPQDMKGFAELLTWHLGASGGLGIEQPSCSMSMLSILILM